MIKSSRKRIWIRNLVCVRDKINANRILVKKPEGRRPLGMCRGRLAYNIKMDLKDLGLDSMDEVDLTEEGDRWPAVVQNIINFRVL